MGSSTEDWSFDDDEEAFLDSEEPADAIALARQALKKKAKEFAAKRDAFLALAATVNEGCQRYFIRADLDRLKGGLEDAMSYWKGRRSRALTSVEKAHAKKESQLRQIGALTKELEASRITVNGLLQQEISERQRLQALSSARFTSVKKWSTIMSWASIFFLVLLVAAFILSA